MWQGRDELNTNFLRFAILIREVYVIKSNLVLIFPKSDVKYSCWANALNKRGLKTFAMDTYYPLYLFLLLIFRVRFLCSTLVYVPRYLNGNDSYGKAFIYLVVDIFSVALCKILRIKIVWFLHNIDEETYHYPAKIVDARRYFFGRYANKILVMDRLLLDENELDRYRDKVDYICFGEAENVSSYGLDESRCCEIKKWVSLKRKEGVLVGACFTSRQDKNISLKCIEEILEADTLNKWYFVVVGGGGPGMYDKLKMQERCFVYEDSFKIPNEMLSEFDFSFKVSTDKSILLSVYGSCSNNIPFLTINYGSIARIVEAYNIGCVLDKGFSKKQLEDCFLRVKYGEYGYKEFLDSHNWDVAAKRIEEALR